MPETYSLVNRKIYRVNGPLEPVVSVSPAYAICIMTRYQPTPQEQAQRKKEALAERVEKLSRVRILEAVRKKLPDVLSRPDLEMVALDYFRRLGHDNHRRIGFRASRLNLALG